MRRDGMLERVRRRTPAILTGSVIIAAVLSSCSLVSSGGGDSSGGSDGKTQLRMTWFTDPQRTKVTNQALDLFEKRNPTIKVSREPLSQAQFMDRLNTEFAGGRPPDVMDISLNSVDEYASRGGLLSISPKMVDTKNIPASLLNGVKGKDGKPYGVPFAMNFLTMAYNPELVQKAGVSIPDNPSDWTWERYQQVTKDISDKLGPRVYGAMDEGWFLYIFETYLQQRGKQLFRNCKPAFDKQDLIDFWNMTESMRKSGAATSAEITSASAFGDLDQFAIAKKIAAVSVIYSNSLGPLRTLTGADIKLVGFPGESPTPGTYRGVGDVLSIAAKSKNPAEAGKLVNFLVNDPDAGKILGTIRGLPVNTTVAKAIEGSVGPADRDVLQFVSTRKFHAAPGAPPAGTAPLAVDFLHIHESITFEKISVSTGVDKFFTAMGTDLTSCKT